MNRILLSLALLTLASFSAQAGVKVTSLDLKTDGPNGYVNLTLDGRSNELPDLKVYGKTIEITLSDAEAFSSIFKNVNGAQLSANVLNGKVIVKAVLPYDIKAEGVDLGWKNKNIEVVFPRGKVVKETTTVRMDTDRPTSPAKPATPKKVENTVLAKVENAVVKEALNEDYLNNLMKEETTKTAGRETDLTPPVEKKDEVNLKQAALAKPAAEVAVPKNDNFSFAGYAVKFAVFLAMVLGLFYGVVQLLKKGVFSRGKLGFLNNSQMIQVLSTTYVAPKRSLMVVKAHNQIFLVSNSENGLQFLAEMTDKTGLIKEGEKFVTGSNFDLNLGSAESTTNESSFKLKENINESTPEPEAKGIAALTAKDIVKFSDELKKKAKKLKPIEFN
jgi:flagellar biogenesis protein FliO